MSGKAKIGVIGAGLMGHGIAQVFAVAGHEVSITDTFEAARNAAIGRVTKNLADMGLDVAATKRITVCADLASTVRNADVVIEAALENMELKQQLFVDIEAAAPAHAILASNTSVMPITQIMSRLKDKSRALGTHFWNPPFLVPLVEVVRTADTSDAAVRATIDLLTAAGKTAVEVKKDVPGFVGNRLQHALWREAISIVEQGICDARTVDMVVKSSFGLRSPVLGPLENADLVGLDLTLAIHSQVLPYVDSRPGPSPYLEKLVRKGKLGFKSGEGLQTWSAEEQAEVRKRLMDHLMEMNTRR